MAAAAFIENSCCGRETQLKIWIGRTVNSSIGPVGVNGTYANAPTTINGAVSPKALEIANITPVNIPPDAAGSTWYNVVCHFVAPKPYDATRIDAGTALRASLVATIIIGRINNAKVKLPAKTLLPKLQYLTNISRPNNP